MKLFGKFAAFALALALASSAHAASISAGQQNVAVGTTASTSYTSGTLLGSMSGTFTGPGLDYTATYTSWVYQGGTGATCPTCLDFVYTVNDVSGSSLESASIFNFAGYAANVFFVSGGAGTANDNLSGSSIQFVLGNLGNGQSATFVDFTNATSFGTGNVSVQNGVAGNGPAFAPTPEPSSLILLGSGMVSGAGMLLRRRRSIA